MTGSSLLGAGSAGRAATSALGPTIMGEAILTRETRDLAPYVAITTEPPWRLVSSCMGRLPLAVLEVPGHTLDAAALAALRRQVPSRARCLVGVGSGISMDAAKHVAWQLDLPLELIPTVAATDAPFSTTIVTRQNGIYRSLACPIAPHRILVDLAVLRQAPARLNLAGIGDKLCAHTALWDWRLSVARGHGPPLDASSAFAEEVVQTLDARAAELAALTSEGLRLLMELHAREGMLLRAVGHGRFISGSEHLLVQLLERQGKTGFLHGEGVCLATITMAWVQGHDPERIAGIARRTAIRFRPAELGLTMGDVQAALEALPDYAKHAARPYTVSHELDPARLTPAAWDRLQELLS